MEQDSEGQSVRDQLERAVRDLWTSIFEAGDDHIVMMDRRRMGARVQQGEDGYFHVSWDVGEDEWQPHERPFDNPREACFHAYQGPH